jgi:hypothetical protein
MIVLHTITTEKDVIVPKDEFKKLVENYRKFESIEVKEEYDPDYLSEEEFLIRQEALEELERGETINFDDVKDNWLKGEPANV